MKKIILILMLIFLPLVGCSFTVPSINKPNTGEEVEGKTEVTKPNEEETKPNVENPGDGNENNPGDGNENNPGDGNENNPGDGNETNPGDGNENNPGDGNETNPGDGNENNPGDGNETNPGDGNENNPGDGNETNPDDGNIQEFTIKDPSFETRKINDISEVTMDDFFNLGNRIDIKVTISDKELRKLQADYETGHKSEIYRLASKVVITLTNNGTKFTWEFENVGIRQKGNTSRKHIIDGEGNIQQNHFKLSFDETFDDPQRYDSSFISQYGNPLNSNRDFLGMSGLDFKWDKNYDHTHIREVYANYLYRACGILAQHSGLSTFSLIQSDRNNKETSMGLCTVYEPATKSFIKRSLKSEDEYINMSDWTTEKAGTFGVAGAKYGDLYKCIWGANLTNVNGNVGIGNISGSYIPLYDRKTNKDVEYYDDLLSIASRAIRSGNYNEISKYVDLEYLAMCEAVGFVVGNPDSMRYNTNNFMIYMRRTDGKMVFIPIDSDRCFGIVKDWNPTGNAMMDLDMLSRKNVQNENTISLLLNTILSTGTNEAKELYIKYCNMIKESSWVTNETFNQYFNKAKSSYGEYYFSLNDESTNVKFSRYIEAKLRKITSNDGSNNDNNNDNNNPDTTTKNIYLVSSVNNWYASENYKLTKVSDDTYSISFVVTNESMVDGEEGKCVKFKFNGGGSDYSKLDWSIDQNTQRLNFNGGSSYRLYNVKVGNTVSITINIQTADVQIVVK